ncbi:hypothetical protein [Actinomadura sp. B10D3]|uniref:hypothetical protein n=1 Tax=Actinomadura sp. B10D3 TaxID=3153557 RepID=UPI00325F4D05
MSEIDDLEQPPVEANEADAVEQRAVLDEDERAEPGPLPDDANEADAAEQLIEVRLDEDDYR